MRLSINKARSLWWTISSVIILSGIASMIVSWQNPNIKAPLRLGLDFVGGTRLQFVLDCNQPGNCDQPIDINAVREVAKSVGLSDSSIQVISEEENGKRRENGITIRTKNLDVNQSTALKNALSEKIGTFDPQKNQVDSVGPSLGRELFRSGLYAVLISFLGIVIYLAVRFQLDYAVFAIIALLHDVLVTIGAFSALGVVANVEIDSLFIVAILTIIGFSVNDTVVIYDRIRENQKINPQLPIPKIIDDAVNQTLSRSINTSLTTLLAVVAIFLFGGETLKNFSLALIIGFTAGSYSSIFIASTLLSWWRERTEKSTTETVDPVLSSPDS